MGGSPSAPAPVQQDNSMMIALLQQQIQQSAAAQRAAEEAAKRAAEEQRQSLIRSEDTSAGQRAAQSQTAASETLARLNTQQELSDEASKKKMEDQYTAEGMAATGGGYDYNKARQEALGYLGAASPFLSSTAANAAASPYAMNPAMTTAGTVNQGFGGTQNKTNKNVFAMPNSQGLTFGGS